MSDRDETGPATAPRWKRRQSLELVYKLNEECLGLLSGVAADKVAPERAWLVANRELWAKLSPEARKRVARLPFVILDLHFADEEWWRRVTDARESAVREPDPTNGFPQDLSERLVQETLMFAWQMAQSDRTSAQVTFAMRPAVAEMIGALMPGDVREIASRWQGEIRLRWDNNGGFWGGLLVAAQTGDADRLAELQLHAKLLALGPLVRTGS